MSEYKRIKRHVITSVTYVVDVAALIDETVQQTGHERLQVDIDKSIDLYLWKLANAIGATFDPTGPVKVRSAEPGEESTISVDAYDTTYINPSPKIAKDKEKVKELAAQVWSSFDWLVFKWAKP